MSCTKFENRIRGEIDFSEVYEFDGFSNIECKIINFIRARRKSPRSEQA